MNKLTEQDLDKLEARSEVYEVGMQIDLALRVFPNGSKTWIYIYYVEQFERRKTLGIFPEMSLEQAREAADNVRRADAMTPPEPRRRTSDRTSGKDSANASWKNNKVLQIGIAGGVLLVVVLIIGFAFYTPSDKTENNRVVKNIVAPPTSSPVEQPLKVETNEPETISDNVAVALETPGTDLSDDMETADADTPVISAAADEKMPSADDDTLVKVDVEANETVGIAPQDEPPSEPSEVMNERLKRAQFTTGIKDREPIDNVDPTRVAWNEDDAPTQLYFFTELTNMEGRTVYHQWKFNGEVQAEISFKVRSSWRWRVFSRKQIVPTMTGTWRVSVFDDEDNIIYIQEFKINS